MSGLGRLGLGEVGKDGGSCNNGGGVDMAYMVEESKLRTRSRVRY